MLIERLQVRGLLSFGPVGIDLRLEPLNVLIGPNGSGKSNLLQTLALLRDVAGGEQVVFSRNDWGNLWWQGPPYLDESAPAKVTIVATVTIPEIEQALEHRISLFTPSEYPFIESIGLVDKPGGAHDPELLRHLHRQYNRMRLYRDWTFGASAPQRQGQSGGSNNYALSDSTTDGLAPPRKWSIGGSNDDALSANGDNLAIVISRFTSGRRERLAEYLDRFYDGIVAVSTPVEGGTASVVVEEKSGRLIPASRLSDGTLRYLSLLTVLLDPTPPPLIGIEEPELGLHPDVIYDLAELLVEASGRTQLVVTTHSPTLIDALTDYPSSVVACEKHDGETRFRRVNPEALKTWQNERSLGEVWSMGGIGGNRW